ncbi:glutathione S-transferase kappa 1-like [Dysidea avara]|uniref:glutathione S-transferase kappa 1-like n=1 Tax=Dysidea avara TaxID=196820 RepID=UPI003329B56A
MSRQIKLFYDVLSPYSWIAFEVLHRYRQKWNLHLQLCPFFLSGIMQLSENRPPGVVPLKARYMGKDIIRLAEYYRIPLNSPANPAEVLFVKGSLKAQRLLTAANLELPDKVEAISRELWMRVWSRDEDITEDDSLVQACLKGGIAEDTIKKLLARCQDQDVKDKLKSTTQEAFDLGAFGAPFIVVVKQKPEVFFGSDRFELIAHMMGVKWEGPQVELAAKI